MTSLKRLVLLAALAVVVGACSADEAATTTTTAPDTTTSLVTTTTAAPTTTTAPPTTTTTAAEDPEAAFADAAPASWVGVTTDYEAVEVDTATGDVIRSLGQVSTAEDVENAECSACVNAIDAVWRTFDGSHTIISECCEPAAGQIHVLADTELPLEFDSADTPVAYWTAAPAPDSTLVAFLGYGVAIADAADPTSPVITSELADFPVSNAVWSGPDTVRWLEDAAGTLALRTLDIVTGTSTAVEVTGVPAPGIAGLAVRDTGEMVAMYTAEDGSSTALVLSPEGEIVTEFEIEDGSRPGGYDASGAFLIYTDDDGVVRWLSEDGAGVVAEGYLFASW